MELSHSTKFCERDAMGCGATLTDSSQGFVFGIQAASQAVNQAKLLRRLATAA